VPDVLVLCYHAVSERWPAALAITPQHLEEHVSMLADRGYRGVTFHEAVTGPRAPKTLAITFDDAYRSVFELARPILSRVGFPGSVYAVTGQIGREGPMSWPGIDRWIGTPHEGELIQLPIVVSV
jgi:peptidoglycan/xylan/chitin deacetylase (PgdA/CDA1 family)